jgi:hypothetical protein
MAQKFLNGIDVSSTTVVNGSNLDSGSTVLDIQGSQGQLFSVTNILTGDLFSVSDVSGIPIFNVNSSGAVDVDGTLNLGDSNKIQLGASQDLQIYHDGSHSYIRDQGTGNLIITGSQLTFSNVADTEYMVKMVQDGTVELYYNGSKKLETTSTGVTVTGNLAATNLSGTNTGDQVLPSDFVSKANGGTFDGNLTINIADNGSAPAMTSTLNLRGFEGRGAGIKIKDSANSAADSSNREWFIGSGYSQSGFNIGYSATASQSSYAAQNKFTLTTAGNATFAGTVAGTNLSGTNTGDQTLPTDFVSATTGGNFGGDITVYTGAGTGSLSVGREAGQSIKLYITDTSNSITAAQDSDGNQAHNFILNRTFAGTGDNNFKIQKGGTDQFTLNSAGLATFAGSVQITGALTVNGTTTTINTATVEVEDNILQLNTTQGTPDTATATTSGISIYRGVDENDVAITEASLIFDDADDTWDLTNNLTVAGDVIGASFAVPSGASTGFLKADGTVDSTTYSGFTFGATDLTFSGADPGDIVWRNADGDEVHRLWSGTNDYLTYRNDAGTTYELISAGSTSYNNSNWDTAYTHSQAAHAPTNAEANVYSTATELLTAINTLSNPTLINGLSKKNSRYQDGITSEYPLGHYTPGETLFEIDTTWSNAELQSYFDTPYVSWDEVANAPGGYAIYITGSQGVGGPYSSGFPMIPIDQDATYYQECWIKNATSSTMGHYMGSADLEADRTAPASGSGNPGSYGYWVMSNHNPGDTWTKVSGYITGHHASNTGSFETDATYFTPLALFNYTTPAAGTRACWISGWKVIRVDKVGDRIFQDDVQVKGKLEVHTLDANTSSTTALVMNVNEVEKRTLGSLAFSSATIPTVAGVYLPLSAGSGSPLTGDLYVPGFMYHVGDTNTYFGFGAPDVFDLATGGSRKLYADSDALYLYYSGSQKLRTTNTGVTVTGDIQIDSTLLSNQENTDIDSAAAEVVAQVAISYTAAFFDFVVKKGTNVRSGTVYACHDGTNVEFTETSTNDLGNTSDVTLSVDKTSTNLRLIATVTSNDWSVKSLIRAI